jgi:hypothetical protein
MVRPSGSNSTPRISGSTALGWDWRGTSTDSLTGAPDCRFGGHSRAPTNLKHLPGAIGCPTREPHTANRARAFLDLDAICRSGTPSQNAEAVLGHAFRRVQVRRVTV